MDTDSEASIPDISVGSAGSSVSSRLQEEYQSLLKYALVTPMGTLADGMDEDVTQQEDQIRLLRNSNPNPTPLPPPLPKRTPPASSYASSSSSEHEPVRLITTREVTRVTPAPSAEISNGASVNTTEGEKAKEVSVQNRVFGSLPTLYSSGHTVSDYTLDELDATLEDETASLVKRETVRESEILTSAHDSDIVRLEGQIDEWNIALRQNILAELTQIKLKLLQQQKCRILDEREKSNERMARLTLQNEELKELVANCERTIAQKDSIIANLTTSLNKQKTKEGLVRSFSQWKLRHCDEKREEFCGRIADDFYARKLMTRAFRSWMSVQENKWKERVERACQNRAQEVCEKLTRDYEDKVAALQQQLGAACAEIASLRSDREQFEERMKKGFMRGVCALNLEAMTMFKEEESTKENVEPPETSVVQPLQSMPVLSEHPLPNLTTAPYPPYKPNSKQVLVRLQGTSNKGNHKTAKPQLETVVVERHSGPTHHPPLRVPPKKHKVKNQMSVRIVE
ncbi:centrosomal protein POC5-like [Bolinopsis microptera]|uniref:centrosomal protein POC5-like n=1 Tax=Bolinopsis microptera TaxID=2820187 RepID=UPI003078F215